MAYGTNQGSLRPYARQRSPYRALGGRTGRAFAIVCSLIPKRYDCAASKGAAFLTCYREFFIFWSPRAPLIAWRLLHSSVGVYLTSCLVFLSLVFCKIATCFLEASAGFCCPCLILSANIRLLY